MKRKITNLQTRLYLFSAIILLVGLGGAVLIYVTADSDLDNILEFKDSKLYMHDLELYGGKANVLASEVMRWFVGLWRGKSLAFTVAGITSFVSFGVFLAAEHLRPG